MSAYVILSLVFMCVAIGVSRAKADAKAKAEQAALTTSALRYVNHMNRMARFDR